ncbi:hypothetical protein NARC_170019 [Candidatus Nitrosocosmicus arcticus]|uniref:Uncharacterized protein n=1 Tax=Candidatus Nitrosocosmicus arcticus TaxID=2035267 RepID=A0A557SRR1_9ARCH|nr:hypothetical protein NARC_170019 [Candidatus Nitrosocosmicus arcticus]
MFILFKINIFVINTSLDKKNIYHDILSLSFKLINLRCSNTNPVNTLYISEFTTLSEYYKIM